MSIKFTVHYVRTKTLLANKKQRRSQDYYYYYSSAAVLQHFAANNNKNHVAFFAHAPKVLLLLETIISGGKVHNLQKMYVIKKFRPLFHSTVLKFHVDTFTIDEFNRIQNCFITFRPPCINCKGYCFLN